MPDTCTCTHPWTMHCNGFLWGSPPDGTVHLLGTATTISTVELQARELTEAEHDAMARDLDAEKFLADVHRWLARRAAKA